MNDINNQRNVHFNTSNDGNEMLIIITNINSEVILTIEEFEELRNIVDSELDGTISSRPIYQRQEGIIDNAIHDWNEIIADCEERNEDNEQFTSRQETPLNNDDDIANFAWEDEDNIVTEAKE